MGTTNLLNNAEFKRALIQLAVDASYYWREHVGSENIRVSQATREEGQAALQTWMRAYIAKKQRKGKTL